MADIGWLAAASMRLAGLRTPTLADEAADGDPGGVSGRNETGNPPTYTAAVDRFLFALLNPLAEDKRFELLRVSPTRFPILLLAVRRWSEAFVTRHDGTGRTVPNDLERQRMRRKLRRTSPSPAGRSRGIERLLLKPKHIDLRAAGSRGRSAAVRHQLSRLNVSLRAQACRPVPM
jgi:hypothetical protein